MKFSRLLIAIIFIISVSPAFTGCAKKASKDVRIELTALDGKDISSDISSEVSSSDAVFPSFISGDEECQKELDKLNREVEKIRSNYEERRQKDKEFIVHTYVSPVTAVPQCTIFWYEEHSLLGDDYNMMTLAYNKNTGEIMTSKEALLSHQIDSVTLSTNVGKLFQVLEPSLEIKETEMQGFETDENGDVTAFFMKLIAEKRIINNETQEEEVTQEIHFYSYDPAAQTLRPVSDLGYDMP